MPRLKSIGDGAERPGIGELTREGGDPRRVFPLFLDLRRVEYCVPGNRKEFGSKAIKGNLI